MTQKQPTPTDLQKQCDDFNAKVPVGGDVTVMLDGATEPLKTTTRSEALVMCGHSAVIWLNGVSGAYLLERVTPANSLHQEADREIAKLKANNIEVATAFSTSNGDELLALKLAVVWLAAANDAMRKMIRANYMQLEFKRH